LLDYGECTCTDCTPYNDSKGCISDKQAEDWLTEDLQENAGYVRYYLKQANSDVLVTQYEFDALVDYTFNRGAGTFRDSGMPEAIGRGDYDGAASLLRAEADRASGSIAERRRKELRTFTEGVYDTKTPQFAQCDDTDIYPNPCETCD